jgi:hypothetical protein
MLNTISPRPLTFHIDSNKDRPGQFADSKNIEKDWVNKQGEKTQETVKIDKLVKNGKPNFRETINLQKQAGSL